MFKEHLDEELSKYFAEGLFKIHKQIRFEDGDEDIVVKTEKSTYNTKDGFGDIQYSENIKYIVLRFTPRKIYIYSVCSPDKDSSLDKVIRNVIEKGNLLKYRIFDIDPASSHRCKLHRIHKNGKTTYQPRQGETLANVFYDKALYIVNKEQEKINCIEEVFTRVKENFSITNLKPEYRFRVLSKKHRKKSE